MVASEGVAQRRTDWRRVAAFVLLGLCLVIGAVSPAAAQPRPGGPPVVDGRRMTRVPDLRGQTPDQAVQTLKAAGLVLGQPSQAVSNVEPPGRIIVTRPSAGAPAAVGSAVSYEIALAPPAPPRLNLMPALIDMPLSQAEAILARLQLRPAAINSTASNAPVNQVITQSPLARQPIPAGVGITLTVSAGEQLRVPDVRGDTPAQAAVILRAAGFAPGEEDRSASSLQPPGRIIATKPLPGAPAPRGSPVDYVVALAPPPPPSPTRMPNLYGMPLDKATAVLAGQQLRSPAVNSTASDLPANSVTAQRPVAQQPVSSDTVIVLTVSDGSLVRVPDLRGLTPAQARQAVRAAGLSLGQQSVALSNTLPIDRIIASAPAPGQLVTRGTPVGYEVAEPPPVIAPVPPPPPPVQPPPVQPPPPPPPPVQPPPTPPSPVEPSPSAAPTSSTVPAPSAAAPDSGSSAVAAASSSAAATNSVSDTGPTAPGSDQAGPLAWTEKNPGWAALIVAALVVAAGVIGWLLGRPHPVPTPTPVAPPAVPVVVTASMITPPSSSIENAQPSADPLISLAWRIDPPDAQIQTPTPEEPSP